jgi:hypothetical protein
MRNIADDSLYVASARSEMPWIFFRDAVDSLLAAASPGDSDLFQTMQTRRAVIRNLDCLGHCDFDFAGGRVYVAPPVLARLPVGRNEAVLCGSRTPDSVARLTESVAKLGNACEVVVQEEAQRLSPVPSRVVIRARGDGLERLSESLGLIYSEAPPAWLLANLAPSVRDADATARWQDVEEPNWEANDFDPVSLSFRSNPACKRPTTRLTSYRDRRTSQFRTWAWRSGKSTEMDRDWGRYWLFRELGVRAAFYDERQFTLTVPSGAPLPRLLARTAALCSGSVPVEVLATSLDRKAGRGGVNIYKGVPPQVGNFICEKLGQRPIAG